MQCFVCIKKHVTSQARDRTTWTHRHWIITSHCNKFTFTQSLHSLLAFPVVSSYKHGCGKNCIWYRELFISCTTFIETSFNLDEFSDVPQIFLALHATFKPNLNPPHRFQFTKISRQPAQQEGCCTLTDRQTWRSYEFPFTNLPPGLTR